MPAAAAVAGPALQFGGTFDRGATDPEFYKPDMLDEVQAQLENLLGPYLARNLSGRGFGGQLERGLINDPMRRQTNRALRQQLSGRPDFSQNESFFNTGVLQPALRSFDREVAPRINEEFAQQGARFSTRRGMTQAQALGDVYSNAQEELARYNASAIESAKQRQLQAIGIPLQQTLGRIGGFNALQAGRIDPIISLLGQDHRNLVVGPGRGAAQYAAGSSLLGAMGGGGGK